MEQIVPYLQGVEPLENFKLRLYFDDGVKGIVNLETYKSLFESNMLDFKKVSFSDSALIWNEDVEFDLLSCYLEITNQTFEEYAGR